MARGGRVAGLADDAKVRAYETLGDRPKAVRIMERRLALSESQDGIRDGHDDLIVGSRKAWLGPIGAAEVLSPTRWPKLEGGGSAAQHASYMGNE